jgi:SPP1 family predicted phage head-tail adaptor
MTAGALRHRIAIQSKTVATDGNGNRSETWADHYTCWASISSSGGREFYQARQVNAELTHEVSIRFKAGITAIMRIKYTDPKDSNAIRYLEIRAVNNPDQRRRMLSLMCREVN